MGYQHSKIFELLKNIALQDGKMSLDETMLISNVLKSTVSFDNALHKAKMDGVIDTEEKEELDVLRTKIFEDAASIAEQDDIVSEEEAKLLNKLLEIIVALKDQY